MRPKTKKKVVPKRKTGVSHVLARPGDPMVDGKGNVIQAVPFGKEARDKAAQIKVTARTFKPETKRALRDLPIEGNALRAVLCVLTMTLIGLSDREIAQALDIDTDHLSRVREHASYEEFFGMLQGEFINANSDMIQARLAAMSTAALDQVGKIAFEGEHEKNRLTGSIDLLDRGGVTSIANSSKTQRQQNTLRIVVEAASKDDEHGVSVQLETEDLEHE